MNCAQVKERLIDFLYDEMPAEARDELKKHLNTCADCRVTIAAYERTLGSARAALGGPLAQEPPARVHLAIMAAAQAAVKAAPARAKARPADDEPGFLARLWRAPWLLPAFGAASVATAVFLVRVLKNPEVIPGQNLHSIEERSLATPESLPPPEPTHARQLAAAAEAEVPAKPEGTFDETRGSGSARSARRRALKEDQPQAERPSPVLIKMKKKGSGGPLDSLRLGDGPASEADSSRFAEPPPPRAIAKASKSVDDPLAGILEKEDTPHHAQPLAAPAGAKAAPISVDDLDDVTEMAAAPAKKAPTAARAVQPMREYPAASAAGAPSPSATPPASPHEEMNQAEAASEVSAEADNGVAAKDSKTKGSDKAGPSLDESVRKAERLYASEDWAAAAQAYRDLLRRFPGHKDAPKWRDRMNESNAAYVRALEAKRRKSPSDDPLSGSMK